ncbi:TonB-dependent receptor plug domain-containing protein [Lysobacter sp. A378]
MRFKNSRLQRSRLSAALFAALLMPITGAVSAQDVDTDQNEQAAETTVSEQDPVQLNSVVVTGSRIKRVDIEGPAPVTVITAEDLETQGFSTVYDALSTLTQFTGSVQNELNQSGFTPNASFLNLRGLGPGYQLVLINGRRAADYPMPYNGQSNAVNLNAIPAAAIERIEILSGGASAIYGSDAVAGVVNIIMKTNYEGDLVTVRGGTTTRGGGDTGRVQWVGGKLGDAWSLTYAFEYLEREAIFASQRDFMDSYRDDPSVDPSEATAVAGVQLVDGFTGEHLFPAGIEETCGRFSEFETFALNSDSPDRCYYYGYPATQAIRNSDRNYSAYLYGTYDFGNDLQAWGQLSYNSADAIVAGSTQFWQSGYFYDPSLDTLVNTQRIFTPDEVGGVGSQSTMFEERSIDLAAGLRGTIFDGRFDWDATVSHARYEVDIDRPRFLENNVRDYFLGEQLPGVDPILGAYPIYNLNQDRYFNPMDAATFNSLNTRVRTAAESKVTQASFVLTGDLFELPAGPLGMAAVIEGASQEYRVTPDARIAPDYAGDEPIYNLTGTGGGGERDRYAVGLEFSVPIFSTLKASLAGRYDKYDDMTAVDDAATWSAGLEWRPFESFLVRGSHAVSFRAPDMHYVYADESGFYQTVLDEYRCRRDGLDPTAPASADNSCAGDNDYSYSVFGLRSGSTELQEEEGDSTTIGIVWDVVDDMSISVDWYDITLEGGVSDIDTGYLLRNEADCRLGETRDGSPVDGGSTGCNYYLSLIDRLGTDAVNDNEIDQFRSVPFNQARVKTSGIDAKWRYQIDTDRHGDWNLQLGWTHVLKLEDQEFPGDDVRNTRDHRQFFNFRSRVNWQVGWERDDWNASVYGYRWGSLPNWAETGRIGSHVIWNANVQKKLTDNLTAGVFVNNVLDELHPEDDTYNSYPFFWRAYQPIGREVFFQLDYRFN